MKAKRSTSLVAWILMSVLPAASGKPPVGTTARLAPRFPKVNTVSFLNDVEPILTRAGCNQGSCHGSQFGKGGFRLSLAGYDPEFDHSQIVRQAGGRRVNRLYPHRSLVLRKASLALAHQGGLRLRADSDDFRVVLRWITEGTGGPDPRDPAVMAIRAVPERLRMTPGQTARLRVVARYTDSTVRDVTAHTRISSLSDVVATASPEGSVVAKSPGSTAVMLRYSGLAAVSHVSIPYRGAGRWAGWRADTWIDRAIERRWREMGLSPSGPCTDAGFLRRATLTLIGTLPTAGEVRVFLADRAPDKRARLIDRLLDRPEYADYWALKWSDLLRNNRSTLGDRPMWALSSWIRRSIAENTPFDRFARELLTSSGSALETGPVNYYRVASTPQDLTETTAQLFLGVRLQCAKCHHHPFEKWSQQDYYQFAAFFARTGVASGEPVVKRLSTGEVTHPKTGRIMQPAPLAIDGRARTASIASIAPIASIAQIPSMASTFDRREALADWLVSRENVLFAKVVVNRYWAALMGRGIVDPVDDMRVTNPPSNPELLDGLATDFIAHDYDLKRLIRTICASQVFGLTSVPTKANGPDAVFYSHYLARRLPAEVMLDAVSAATGVPERFTGLPIGTRAIQLPDSTIASTFLDTFGRPPRSTACECERSSDPTLAQSLRLLSGADVSRKVANPEGRVAELLRSGKNAPTIVEELYLSTLGRLPAMKERQLAMQAFAGSPRKQAAEDLLWALLNTQEFSYVR